MANNPVCRICINLEDRAKEMLALKVQKPHDAGYYEAAAQWWIYTKQRHHKEHHGDAA
jgi:hypothetical protein